MGFVFIFLSLLLLVQLAIRRSNYLKPIENDKKTVEPFCPLTHVPTRLHWDGYFLKNSFFHDEKLYWRIKKENADNPFGTITLTDISAKRPFDPITLTDISINRSGISPLILSEPQDVFINITGEGEPFYKEFDVIELGIKKIGLDKKNAESISISRNSD